MPCASLHARVRHAVPPCTVPLLNRSLPTPQAATASSLGPDPSGSPALPSEGDGSTYEHYEAREELWVDFIAGERRGFWDFLARRIAVGLTLIVDHATMSSKQRCSLTQAGVECRDHNRGPAHSQVPYTRRPALISLPFQGSQM
jgi:hypothetical protein